MTEAPSHDREPSTAGHRSSAQPYRILLAEDDEALRETIAEILEVAFDVVLANCGRQAVDCLAERQVDVALFDVQMGELSGLDVVRIVRREYELELPCLLMTAQPDETVRAEASRLGVAELIEKPFAKRRLVDSVATVMERAYGIDEAAAWFDARRN